VTGFKEFDFSETFSSFEQEPEPEPLKCGDRAIMSPDGRALWENSEGRFWVIAVPDEETFYIECDFDGNTPGWFQFVCDADSLHSAMFPDETSGAEMAKALLDLGVASSQPFFIHMTFEYYRGDGWSTDDEMIVDWALLDVEPLSPEETAARWETWLKEWAR
jgi:hypothetical protein